MGQLAVDAGQSGVRVLLVRDDLPDRVFEYPGVRSHENVIAQVAEVVSHALSAADSRDTWIVAAGITGLTTAHGGADTLLAQLPVDVTATVVGHDSVTSYLGALADRSGAVLAVGTGVIVTACSATAMTRVDGWGHLLGDAGGGFWIGARGLAAALEAFDGRSPATTLTTAAIERFGPVGTLPSTIYENPDRVAAVASFCVDVVACAESGDVAAHSVLAEGAHQLARSAHAALRRVHLTDVGAVVSWSGNLMTASGYVRDLVRGQLAALPLKAQLAPPLGTPIDGARALIDLPSTHPLHGAVSRASRTGK